MYRGRSLLVHWILPIVGAGIIAILVQTGRC